MRTCARSTARRAASALRSCCEFTALAPFAERLAGKLSGGMKQKLGLACALLGGGRRLLLLDEPGVGVDSAVAARAVAHGQRSRGERRHGALVDRISRGSRTVFANLAARSRATASRWRAGMN